MVTVLSTSKLASKSTSSESEVSSPSAAASGGEVGALPLPLLLCLLFLKSVELAHDLTFLGLRFALRLTLGFSESPKTSSSSCIGDGSGESFAGTERAGSEALDVSVGTEGSLRRDSRRKKPLFFAGTRGRVGLFRLVGDVVETADMGLLRLKASLANCRFLRGDISNIAPAVLGRPSSSTVGLSDRRPIRADGGVDAPPLTIEDRLPVAEWPRKVDSEVSVSDEMVDSGRMYSILSEKPTRALEGGRLGEESESSGKNPPSRSEGCETDLCAEWLKTN